MLYCITLSPTSATPLRTQHKQKIRAKIPFRMVPTIAFLPSQLLGLVTSIIFIHSLPNVFPVSTKRKLPNDKPSPPRCPSSIRTHIKHVFPTNQPTTEKNPNWRRRIVCIYPLRPTRWASGGPTRADGIVDGMDNGHSLSRENTPQRMRIECKYQVCQETRTLGERYLYRFNGKRTELTERERAASENGPK